MTLRPIFGDAPLARAARRPHLDRPDDLAIDLLRLGASVVTFAMAVVLMLVR